MVGVLVGSSVIAGVRVANGYHLATEAASLTGGTECDQRDRSEKSRSRLFRHCLSDLLVPLAAVGGERAGLVAR